MGDVGNGAGGANNGVGPQNGGQGNPPNPPPGGVVARDAVPAWTTPTFATGIVVGLLLVVGALAVDALHLVPSGTSNLVMCCGLGIILGAFGALALVQWQGVVIAGCGAIAVVLFMLLANSAVTHLRVAVAGVPEDVIATLVLENTYAAVANRENVATFFLVERRVDIREAKLFLDGEEVDIEFCIPVGRIQGLGTGRTAQWQLAGDRGSLVVDGSADPIASNCGSRVSSAEWPNLWPVGPALAQEPPDTIDALIMDLDSESPLVRRDARDGLALWGEAAVQPLMDVWAADPTNYRTTLGSAVALTEFLRDNKDRSPDVAALLEETDVELLVDAISHPDRTMRVYATEFLFDLGAPKTAPILLDTLSQASSDGQFNAAFILTNVVPSLSVEERAALTPRVKEVVETVPLGPSTLEQFQQVLTSLDAGQ